MPGTIDTSPNGASPAVAEMGTAALQMPEVIATPSESLAGSIDKAADAGAHAGVEDLAKAEVPTAESGAAPSDEVPLTETTPTSTPEGISSGSIKLPESPYIARRGEPRADAAVGAIAPLGVATAEGTQPQEVDSEAIVDPAANIEPTAEVSSDAGAATFDKEAKRQEDLKVLEAKFADKSITSEEYKTLKKLKEDPEARMMMLDQKVKDFTATDEEFAEWRDGDIPDVESSTPEDFAVKAEKELLDVQTKAMEKMLSGDFEGATEDIMNYNKALAESQGLSISKDDQDRARNFVEGIMKPEKAANPKETAKMRHIKEKLQDLARMEMQLRSQAEVVKKMNKDEDNLKNEVNMAEADYVNEQNPDEKQKKLLIYSGRAMHLSRQQEAIKLQKGVGRDILIKRRQARGYIHRKLGTHNFVYNVAFGAGTAAAQGGLAVANGYDAVFGFA